MLVSSRADQLFDALLNTKPEIFGERASIVTKSYAETEGKPVEFRQAKALAKVLEEYPVIIREGELIVGSKTLTPFGSPVFPEISCEWLEEELETVSIRNEQPFFLSGAVKKVLRQQIFPYWHGKTVHARLLDAMPKEVLEAHNAGVVFHYYFDRTIGHLVVNYGKVLQAGLDGIRKEIEEELKESSMTKKDATKKPTY
jgi:formate C-acetyltransferase